MLHFICCVDTFFSCYTSITFSHATQKLHITLKALKLHWNVLWICSCMVVEWKKRGRYAAHRGCKVRDMGDIFLWLVTKNSELDLQSYTFSWKSVNCVQRPISEHQNSGGIPSQVNIFIIRLFSFIILMPLPYLMMVETTLSITDL